MPSSRNVTWHSVELNMLVLTQPRTLTVARSSRRPGHATVPATRTVTVNEFPPPRHGDSAAVSVYPPEFRRAVGIARTTQRFKFIPPDPAQVNLCRLKTTYAGPN